MTHIIKPKEEDPMNKKVVKTTVFNFGLAGEVRLLETEDGKRYIHKNYADGAAVSIDDEWNALTYLYRAGYSVPEPYERDDNGLYMRFVEGGNLWDRYTQADAGDQKEMMAAFAKMLYDLHTLTPEQDDRTGGPFIQGELDAIRRMMDLHKLQTYEPYADALEAAYKNVSERTPGLLHRDYHPWNVLLDACGKMYVIDLTLQQGDARFDVAWTYALMGRSNYSAFAEAFLTEYAALDPEVRRDFAFFLRLVNLRWLTDVSVSLAAGGAEESKKDEMRAFLSPMIAQAEQAAAGLSPDNF